MSFVATHTWHGRSSLRVELQWKWPWPLASLSHPLWGRNAGRKRSGWEKSNGRARRLDGDYCRNPGEWIGKLAPLAWLWCWWRMGIFWIWFKYGPAKICQWDKYMFWIKDNSEGFGLNCWKNVVDRTFLEVYRKETEEGRKNEVALSRRQLPFFILFTVFECDY